jgi:N6-adenosine-specific RNA methylase IME4
VKFHPLAELFPLIRGDEFDDLVADVKANGLREPIWTYEDQILDGRNRWLACEAAAIAHRPMREYTGDDALGFVLSMNLHRRHLTTEQKAVLALDVLPFQERQAKERQGERNDLVERIPQGDDGKARDKAAAAVGVNPRYVSDAKRIKEEAPELIERMRNAEITVPQAMRELKERKREERRQENREAIAAAPSIQAVRGAFSTIVLDPPWDWGDEGDQDQLGRARPTYGTMPFEDMLKLPVAEYADTDCHLYLWITNRSLPKGFALLDAWGFRYVTCITWVKPSFGMGNYFRGQTEHALFAVRGSQMLKRKDAGTVFTAARGPRGHSSKPTEFYDLVESCSPGPYLEMFARGNRNGWQSWGAEADAA